MHGHMWMEGLVCLCACTCKLGGRVRWEVDVEESKKESTEQSHRCSLLPPHPPSPQIIPCLLLHPYHRQQQASRDRGEGDGQEGGGRESGKGGGRGRTLGPSGYMVDWMGPRTTGFPAAACDSMKLSSRWKFSSQLLNTQPFTCA